MHFVKSTLLFLWFLLQIFKIALATYHDIPDFEFDASDGLPTNSYYPDDETKNIERTVMSEMAEDEPQTFNEKEKRIRDALLRSTQDVRHRRTLSEVLPILRSLSKQQRLALAALISVQTSAKSGKELNLKQVEEMFGERRNLILPIIFDIANIVKHSSEASTKYNKYTLVAQDDDDRSPKNVHKSKGNDARAARSKRSNSYRDDDIPSYHERKLNMTNFRGTPHVNDQHAIESDTKIHVTLANSNTSAVLSMEAVENLAIGELNGTGSVYEYASNSSNIENLPEPEMLIRPYRVRPRPISERFGNIYLYVADYPIIQIMGSIRRHRYAMTALLADNSNEWKAHMEEMEAKKRREDEDDSGPTSGMCPSIVRYARPQKARSASGEWKYIVNTGQHTQTLRLEKCTHPEQSCTYLTDNFSSRCLQIYNYHRLLSWDNLRGLHIDIFKVPTCCSCQIDGYREKFPPVNVHNADDQEFYAGENRFSASDAIYPISNNDYNDNEGDDTPTGSSSFTPIVHRNKKRRLNKRKKLKRPSASNLGSYLAPPDRNEYLESDTFKRKQSTIAIANRAADRTNTQPVLIGSDNQPEIASPPSLLTTERPSKVYFPTVNTPHKNAQLARLTPSKVLIKRVNYNYHPIIDFFLRDRAVKAAKLKELEARIGHSVVS